MPALDDGALRALLNDDAPCGDLTTETLGIGARAASLEFRARQAMTVCAGEEAVRLFELAGARAHLSIRSGATARPDELILAAGGSAASLHRAWKAAQTLVEWASGIASATAAIVGAANGIPVACTRKKVPGTKLLSVKAVKAGGGIMHRLGLSETLLVFPEHRLFLDETPARSIERMRSAQPEKTIVVEVTAVAEALAWARAGADVLQLEKFSVPQVAECRRLLGADSWQGVLAAAGGIRADNAAAYAGAGAGLLVTSAPYAAPPRDVRVIFSAVA